ncbi:sodium:proton antiporter [Cryomorpha ignava]|uniref:Sodium:proton antiporter n=1 Tax=Cryomorpha ignava TaxID=101383 RepID=A0A7K3WVA6_9FLAO|nr:cation:proton antiporter [Cryomorpha ignava]NEN25580.1 sodium:proton antiporter [Cryomorpha ignava]
MNTYSILIFLSLVVVFSYIFDLIAKKTKIPSVLLLFGTGLALQYILKYFGVNPFNLSNILPVVGTVGLILIVLEGALELKFEKDKIKMIQKTFGSAFFILIITSLLITFLFRYVTHLPFQICLVNAIPLGIISSAIAIPSAADLSKDKREFVIYDSSFSDILGIMFFNFAIQNETYGISAYVDLGKDTIITLVIAVVISVVFLFLMKRITHHIKFFLILSLLILVYAIGKFYHLSALIVVLFLGLFLNNAEIIPISKFKQLFLYEKLKADLNQFLLLTAESAFIIRTFFFLMFGYTMNIYSLLNLSVLMNGLIALIVIYLVRGLYLKYVTRADLVPALFIAPRGLISILLFFSIPDSMKLTETSDGLLLFVILTTSVIMTYGLVSSKKKKTETAEAAPAPTPSIVEGSEGEQ